MWEIYVYYRCPKLDIAAHLIIGQQLVAMLSQSNGVSARLMRKKDAPDTLMEVYRSVQDCEQFCLHMDKCVADLYQKNMATKPDRHIEIFSIV
jgi:hypothetical protein